MCREAFDGKSLGSRGFGGWSSQTKWNGPSGFGLKDVGWNKTNVWVMVKGARDGPDKEETINNLKFEVRPERRQSGQREKGIQHLTSQEIADRKQKGLCFRCNGNCHHPRHQCPDRQLRIMVTKEDEDEEAYEMEITYETQEEEDVLSIMSLSGIIIGGNSKLHIMKLKGSIRGVPILMLVDSGATHNFIS